MKFITFTSLLLLAAPAFGDSVFGRLGRPQSKCSSSHKITCVMQVKSVQGDLADSLSVGEETFLSLNVTKVAENTCNFTVNVGDELGFDFDQERPASYVEFLPKKGSSEFTDSRLHFYERESIVSNDVYAQTLTVSGNFVIESPGNFVKTSFSVKMRHSDGSRSSLQMADGSCSLKRK